MIWAYALGKQDPIVAYVEQRTVDRLLIDGRKFKGMRTKREIRPQPALPPIAYVAADVSREALPVYYRENTFLFNLTERERKEVGRWMSLLQDHVAVLQSWWRGLYMPDIDEDPSDFMDAEEEDPIELWRYLTVRLEFEVRTPSIDQATSRSTWFYAPAWVEYRHTKDERMLAVRYGGQLKLECCCWVYKEMKEELVGYEAEYGFEDRGDDLLWYFAPFTETLARQAWRDRRRRTSRRCLKCDEEIYYLNRRRLGMATALSGLRMSLGI